MSPFDVSNCPERPARGNVKANSFSHFYPYASKDTSSLRHEMKNANMTPYVLNAIIERNEKVDRQEKDWLLDKGRASV